MVKLWYIMTVVARGQGEGGMTGWSTGDFQDGETVSYDTVMVVSRHHIFVKIHRMYNTIINGL